jgi:molecular chaperone GrpE
MKRTKIPVNATDGSNGASSSAAADGDGDAANPQGASTPASEPGDPGSATTAGGMAPELPAATPEERLAALTAERDEMKDRMLRVAAEFENWKKRARKEQTDAVNEARERVLKDMLEVIDNLERAVAMQSGGNGAVDGPAVLKGVDLVLRLFKQKLERYEVRPFEATGQPFDPRVHEAISRVEHPEIPSGAVAAELQKGYRVGERLLRPALVAVSAGNGKSAAPPSEG